MIKTFKKCPEVPVSCPNCDDDVINSIFYAITTDLPENHGFLKVLFYVEKKLLFWGLLINLTSFNSAKVTCF